MVNNGDVAFQAYQILNAIQKQATGEAALTATNHEEFVSIAQKVLAAGKEPVLNAISTVLTRSLIAVRPYNRKFGGLEASADRWGAWYRKLSYGDVDVQEDQGYKLVDGSSIDPFVFRKIPVLETMYLGASTMQWTHSVPKDQLNTAFQSEQGLVNFVSGIALHMANLREQYLEDHARQTLTALMLARSASESAAPESVVHLVTEYNAELGNPSPALTLADLMAPDKVRAFFQFVIGKIAGISRMMEERSQLFQNPVTGYRINRHTPKSDQRMYLLAEVMEKIATQVNANTFNEEFLKLPDHELVSFWQAIKSPDAISGTPPVLNADGTLGTGSATSETNVLGIIMDRDAAGYNVYFEEMEPTIYNPTGRYYNFNYSVRIQDQIDLTEKSVLLLLD